jgi:hypothetical protein
MSTYNDMSKELDVLRKKYFELNKFSVCETQEMKSIRQEMTIIAKKLKEIDSSLGTWSDGGHGNYSEMLKIKKGSFFQRIKNLICR